MSPHRAPRPTRRLAVGAALTVLAAAGCSATEPDAPEPTPAEVTTEEVVEAVTLEGSTGTLELTGDADADVAVLVPGFGREYTEGIACDPPADSDIVGMSRWPGELRFIGEQYADEAAARDAIRVTVHYDCPEHYDAVDEALG